MKANVFVFVLLAFAVAVHASKTGYDHSSCIGQRLMRLYPKTLFNDKDLGSSQITIDTTAGTAEITGQMPILANQNIMGTKQIEQLRACVLNVKAAMESVGLTTMDLLTHNVLQMTFYITKYGKGEVKEELKRIAEAFGSPSTTIVGIEQLPFEDIKLAIEATVVIPDHFIKTIKIAKCVGNELLVH